MVYGGELIVCGGEEERGVESDFRGFDLSSWRDGVVTL